MIGKFVVGIAMLRAKDASDPRVATRRAIRFGFDTMYEASRYVPSGRKRHGSGRACTDTASRTARRTRIKAKRGSGCVNFSVGQDCCAKRDPGAVNGIHHYADDAGAGEAGEFRRFHEVERRAAIHKWKNSGASSARRARRRGYSPLDRFTSKIVERIVALNPSRITGDVYRERTP